MAVPSPRLAPPRAGRARSPHRHRPSPARERCLPVDEVLAALLPEAGLVRGRAVGCSGPAAWSLAFALVARAVVGGVVGGGGRRAGGRRRGRRRSGGAARSGGRGRRRRWSVGVGRAGGCRGRRVRGDRHLPAGRAPSAWCAASASASSRTVWCSWRSTRATVPSMGCDLDLVTTRSRVAGHRTGQRTPRRTAGAGEGGGRRSPRPVERELLLPGPDGRVRSATGGDVGCRTVIPLDRAG